MLAYHGGLTPPALGGSAVRTFVGETATCAIHEHSFTRAAGITPLCLLYRVCDRKPESQTIADSRNTQERRASARRGQGIAPAAPSVSYRMRMLACHGGLRPPALGGSAVRTLPAKLKPVRYTNAHLQERRASARRGSVSPAQSQMLFAERVAPRTTAGLRQRHLMQSSASGEGSHVAVGLPPPSRLFNPQGSFATAPGRVSADLAANCVCPAGTIETQRRGRDRHHRHGHRAPLSK